MEVNQSTAGLAGCPILIVEDDPPNANMLSALLRAEGCNTRIAASAEEALSVVEAFKPRAIVLDLVLPHMSGLVLAQLLKAQASTRNIVIIAVSALNGPATVQMTVAAGCGAFVRKPIDPIAFPQLLLSQLGGTP